MKTNNNECSERSAEEKEVMKHTAEQIGEASKMVLDLALLARMHLHMGTGVIKAARIDNLSLQMSGENPLPEGKSEFALIAVLTGAFTRDEIDAVKLTLRTIIESSNRSPDKGPMRDIIVHQDVDANRDGLGDVPYTPEASPVPREDDDDACAE